MPVRYGAKTQEKKQIKAVEDMGYTAIPENCIKCMECGSVYSVDQNNTWQSSSPIHAGNTALTKVNKMVGGKKQVVRENRNHIPYCKNCLLKDFSPENVIDIKNLLFRMDIPFKRDLWQSTKESWNGKSIEGLVGNYKKNISLSFDSERFVDSDEFNINEGSVESVDPKNLKIPKSKLSKLQERYGYGFTNEEYLNFERKYEKMSVGYSEKTALHTERLITYIIHKVKEEMATASGEVGEAEKWAKLAQKDAQDAKLNISQLSKNDITGGVDLLPQLIEAVEERVSLIPIMPKLRTVPYDDADMIIYALSNYNRRLEGKEVVEYKDVWSFYDDFFYEHFKDKGYADDEIKEMKSKRDDMFKDLGSVYSEPLYSDHHDDSSEDDDYGGV